jgi:hypothetical protein
MYIRIYGRWVGPGAEREGRAPGLKCVGSSAAARWALPVVWCGGSVSVAPCCGAVRDDASQTGRDHKGGTRLANIRMIKRDWRTEGVPIHSAYTLLWRGWDGFGWRSKRDGMARFATAWTLSCISPGFTCSHGRNEVYRMTCCCDSRLLGNLPC